MARKYMGRGGRKREAVIVVDGYDSTHKNLVVRDFSGNQAYLSPLNLKGEASLKAFASLAKSLTAGESVILHAQLAKVSGADMPVVTKIAIKGAAGQVDLAEQIASIAQSKAKTFQRWQRLQQKRGRKSSRILGSSVLVSGKPKELVVTRKNKAEQVILDALTGQGEQTFDVIEEEGPDKMRILRMSGGSHGSGGGMDD
ncbi:MAG: hypothetical protein MI743_02715 [Sneathiellales bacterium]|nr:hypothetical protein [Sneathiellales bacterium]